MSFQENLDRVRDRMDRAIARAHRRPEDVTLIAVTKIFPVEAILEGYAAGLREFGENYVQEFEGKHPQVASLAGAHFHLIGHLQSNKAAKAAELFHVIQTVDSVKLAKRLDATGTKLDVMIEVKLSGEDGKHGVGVEHLSELVDAIAACPNLRLLGLMTMPPWFEDAEFSRTFFVLLRKLAARWNLPRLSMGMSNDLEVAIEEGATDIRVGTALFGKRKKL